MTRVDSSTVGDPSRFLELDELDRRLEAAPPVPRDAGRVALIVSRGGAGVRHTPERTPFAPDTGVFGDAWTRKGTPNPEMQIAVMQTNVAELIANGQPLTLFGDNLIVDLDLSAENLPIGSRLRVGGALLEVTPHPHNGCRKFMARFGAAALKFVQRPETRHRNFRGIYLRVIEGGEVAVGDSVEVLERAAATG